MSGDVYDQAAAALAAQLAAEAPEVQQVYRYLFARVAEEQGVLTLIAQELRPSGERLVYQQVGIDAYYTVDRPSGWTAEQEAWFVARMRAQFLGE